MWSTWWQVNPAIGHVLTWLRGFQDQKFLCLVLFSLYPRLLWELRDKRNLKPWSNGVLNYRKLKTWVYLRLRLVRSCVHLRWLAMTYAHFGRDQICTQVKASLLLFGHPTQVNASWVTSISLSLAHKIQEMSALKWIFFHELLVLVRKIASPFGHPTPFSTQVQLAATCDYLRVRLARA